MKKDHGKKHMLYVIGVPGVGKTTVLSHLTRGLPFETCHVPFVVWQKYSSAPHVVQLGYDRDTFGGTDALGMRAQPSVVEWLHNQHPNFVLAEGDRLANSKFFQAVVEEGYELTVALLSAPDDEIQERRRARNERIGKAQDERWLRSRQTKVDALADEWVSADWRLDGRRTPKKLAERLSEHIVGQQFVALRGRA